MQIFILVDKKDICAKHTWCSLVEENLKEGYAKCQYFSLDPIFKLDWNEYLTYDEYMDALHNYKIVEE
jgi:hypothetical protein